MPMDDLNTPVIPLPNPGEGGPVYSGEDAGAQPVIPLPNPGEGGPVYPGDDSTQPVIPLPNPGEGGPVYPGYMPPPTVRPPRPTPSIVIQPLPDYVITVPSHYAAVRFLNASHGYAPFRIYIDGTPAVNLLIPGSASGYVRIPAGTRTISIVGQDGYTYIEQPFRFFSGSASTVAIVNRTGGLRLIRIADGLQ